MKRALVLAAAGLCAAAAAHAQSVSKKYGWDDGAGHTCMEPYAPAVPKAEETTLKQLLEEVKPEVREFIDDSKKYLECLSVQIGKAREVQDGERLENLVKTYNENVDYQKAVADEFNTALRTLKQEAGLTVAEPSTPGQDKGTAKDQEGTQDGAATAGSGKEASKGTEDSQNSEGSENPQSSQGSETAESPDGAETAASESGEQSAENDKAEEKGEEKKDDSSEN